MWDYELTGISLYYFLNYFIIYSFVGWLWESCLVSVLEKRIVNRGYVMGPVCTIYGAGACLMLIFLKPFSDNVFILYFAGSILTTILEYATGAIMESIFHTSWWDYSDQRFNFRGRICLSSSIGWGFAAILLFRVLHPLTDKFIALYSVDTGKKAIYVIGIIYALDFTFATIAAVDISKQLEKAEYVFSEFVRYIKSFNAAEGREEIKEKALVFFSESPGAEFFRRMMKRYDVSVAVWNDRFSKLGLPNREDVKAAAKRFSERMDLKSFKMNYAHRRVFNAYPHIKTQKRLMDMGFEERFNAEQDKEPGDKEP